MSKFCRVGEIMRVSVFTEERFYVDKEGNYFSPVTNNDFWRRYLDVFSEVTVVARSFSSGDECRRYGAISDPRISVFSVRHYHGAKQFIGAVFSVLRDIRDQVVSSDAIILRAPGVLASLAMLLCLFYRKPYAAELVGDPADVFGVGGVGGIFGSFYRRLFVWLTRTLCFRAIGVGYVTRSILQKKYPLQSGHFSQSYSSINLPKSLIFTGGKRFLAGSDAPYSLLAVGSLEQLYKGFDYLICAMPEIINVLPNVKLTIIGDGIYRVFLQNLVDKKDLSPVVSFAGKLDRQSVFSAMDMADLLVVPSLTEGLPRVVIEAFARGLPTIASDVGGIPELLPSTVLFSPKSSVNIASKVVEVLLDINLRKSLSLHGLSLAYEYEADELQRRRNLFYQDIADCYN